MFHPTWVNNAKRVCQGERFSKPHIRIIKSWSHHASHILLSYTYCTLYHPAPAASLLASPVSISPPPPLLGASQATSTSSSAPNHHHILPQPLSFVEFASTFSPCFATTLSSAPGHAKHARAFSRTLTLFHEFKAMHHLGLISRHTTLRALQSIPPLSITFEANTCHPRPCTLLQARTS